MTWVTVIGEVRVVMIDGNPWFVGKDVATALRYKEPEKAVREHVPDKFKGISELKTPGGVQNVVVINEPGLYPKSCRSRFFVISGEIFMLSVGIS